MSEEKKVREYQFDNMKAILIFLVVFAHLLTKYCAQTGSAGDVLNKLIFSFHMPAFIFVTGMFASYKPKKVFQTMLPLYFIFQCVSYLITVFGEASVSGQIHFFRIHLFTPRFTLWYLVAVMAYQLVIPLIDTEKKKTAWMILIISVLLGVAMGYEKFTDNFMAMSRVVSFFPFFLLGFYEKRFRKMASVLRNNWIAKIITLIMGILLIIGFAYFRYQIQRSWFFNTLNFENSYTPWIRLMCYGLAFLWILILMTWVPNKEIPVIGKIGRNTLPVYLIHGPVVTIMPYMVALTPLLKHNMVAMIILSIVMTFVFSRDVCEKALRKIKVQID